MGAGGGVVYRSFNMISRQSMIVGRLNSEILSRILFCAAILNPYYSRQGRDLPISYAKFRENKTLTKISKFTEVS